MNNISQVIIEVLDCYMTNMQTESYFMDSSFKISELKDVDISFKINFT